MKTHNLQINHRFSDGTAGSMTNPEPEKDWKYVTPGTAGSTIHNYICKEGK